MLKRVLLYHLLVHVGHVICMIFMISEAMRITGSTANKTILFASAAFLLVTIYVRLA
jgi:hypothetical protein